MGEARAHRDLITGFFVLLKDGAYTVPPGHGWTLYIGDEAVAGFKPT